MPDSPPKDPSLAQRLLDGDRRALARAITLVEDDRAEGWELVKEVYPHTGKAAVFVTGEPPWHGLGTVIDNAVTSQEAIKLAGLDWKVQKWLLTANKPEYAEEVSVPGWFATVRTDTNAVLGVVSRQYRVLQNTEAFTFMDQAIQEGAAMWETAGSLLNPSPEDSPSPRLIRPPDPRPGSTDTK